MRIVDVKEGTPIQLEVYCNRQKMIFQAKAKFTAFDALFIEPITQNDKMLDFNAERLIVHMFVEIPGEQPVVFRECVVKGVRYKKEVYHMITCSRLGAKLNRRSRFRIPLGYTGAVRLGSEKGAFNVVVHDLSTSGFSFTCEKDDEGFIGEKIWLVFVDTDEDTKFNLAGVVVRKQKYNNRILYGCRLETASNLVERYVARKQRQAMGLNTVKKSSIEQISD